MAENLTALKVEINVTDALAALKSLDGAGSLKALVQSGKALSVALNAAEDQLSPLREALKKAAAGSKRRVGKLHLPTISTT